MDRETLRRVQLAQLDIAKEIRRVCDENNINYFLDSGTLIGAVRHKGFIPWDDDMDIGMLRCDYERFLKLAPMKLNKDFFIDCWDTNPNCPYPFAKVRKRGTKYVEAISQGLQTHHELYVDVLPYDSFPDSIEKAKAMRAGIKKYNNALFMKTKMAPWKRHKSIVAKLLVRIKYLPSKLIAAANSADVLREKYLKVMTQYNSESTQKVFEEYGALSGGHPIPRRCFSAFEEFEFEGEMFKVPSGYDEILKLVYGDYMQLPPEDQRENRHQILELQL